MDDIRIPFTMQAAVAPDGPSPDPFEGRLPPGWVRIPVSLRVALPAEVLDGTAGAAGTPVAIVPHDLRLGGEPWCVARQSLPSGRHTEQRAAGMGSAGHDIRAGSAAAGHPPVAQHGQASRLHRLRRLPRLHGRPGAPSAHPWRGRVRARGATAGT